jgi:monoamine oxidase
MPDPISGTLYFAGEATDPQFSATVGGAIRSGRRAADEVLRMPLPR